MREAAAEPTPMMRQYGELKRRFPMLQIRIYDAGTKSRHELPA